MSGMWTAPENDPRTYGNPVGETATYREYLDNYRLTIEMKCDGLNSDQVARRSLDFYDAVARRLAGQGGAR